MLFFRYDDTIRQCTTTLERTIAHITSQRDAKLQAAHVKSAAWFGAMEANMTAVSDIIASGVGQHVQHETVPVASTSSPEVAKKTTEGVVLTPAARQAPNEYRCPLTLDLMKDPVMAMASAYSIHLHSPAVLFPSGITGSMLFLSVHTIPPTGVPQSSCLCSATSYSGSGA